MIDAGLAFRIAELLAALAGGAWLGHWVTRARLRVQAARESAPGREPHAPLQRAAGADAQARSLAAEAQVRALRRSLMQLPEIAQRLLGAQNVREIPGVALDLVEELFRPSYAVFYVLRRGEYVAVARRGDCEFELGHRVRAGEGVVGWAALRQLPFTADDAAHESRAVRERDLAVADPRAGFSVCLPILAGEQTIGVILVGPCGRSSEVPKEMGRTIALLTSVAIASVQLLQREQHLAQTDGLTGLLNKRTILEHLRERLAPDRDGPVSVFLFDIDHFKKFNDTNGHLAGDDLLRAMGDLIREHSREGEGLGRYGGEEFVLVMEGVAKGEALAAAERLREAVEHAPFAFRERQPSGRLTISGGVATWPADGGDAAALLGAADAALYEAKNAGRNRVVAHHVPDLVVASDDGEDWDAEKAWRDRR